MCGVEFSFLFGCCCCGVARGREGWKLEGEGDIKEIDFGIEIIKTD